MAVPVLKEARPRPVLPEPHRTPALAPVIRLPVRRQRRELEDDEAKRTGLEEDRRLSRVTIAWTFLGIPIGILLVTGFVAAILAVQGTLTWAALLAGVYGGAIGGAYFGGVAGLARASGPRG